MRSLESLQHIATPLSQTIVGVEKAIRSSPLGLNPRIEGQEILIPVPR